MRPTTIPDECIWPGAVRRVIAGGPGGDPTGFDETGLIAPVEALVDEDVDAGRRFSMLIRVDREDLEKLRHEPHFWLIIHGQQLQPFAFVLEADR